jgi:hypothetical protein
MEKAGFIPEHKEFLDSILLGLPGVKAGKMFGYPAYYVNKKLFTCGYGEGVGVKLPEARASELLAEHHIAAFQPLGHPKMREWVQINRKDSGDYVLDLAIFQSCIAFVSRLAEG